MGIVYKIASTEREFEEGKSLFQKYSEAIELDLSFQGFEEELKTINKQYNKPRGALLIAYDGEKAVGCAALRELGNEIAELKRMFVLPDQRGKRIADSMLNEIIDIAVKFQYGKIRLDTLPDMAAALHLYRSHGFYEIPAYRFNPVEGAVFLEKNLAEG